MIRELTDKMNASDTTRRFISAQYPEETIELSTAVTILDAPDVNPIGWSLRRFLQRRGNVVFTDRRVFVQSSFRSPFTILWAFILLFAVYKLLFRASWEYVLIALISCLLVFQRRPYSRNLSFSELRGIRFGSVRGVCGRGDIVALNLGETVLHLVTSQFIPDELKSQMESLINIDSKGRDQDVGC